MSKEVIMSKAVMPYPSHKRSFSRWGHVAAGWWSSPHELEEKPGVFIIATHGFQMPLVLDVGESENLRFFVLNHQRRVLWRRGALGNLLYAAIYTQNAPSAFLSEFDRRAIEQHLRGIEQPMFETLETEDALPPNLTFAS
jgi:hypothetical protein